MHLPENLNDTRAKKPVTASPESRGDFWAEGPVTALPESLEEYGYYARLYPKGYDTLIGINLASGKCRIYRKSKQHCELDKLKNDCCYDELIRQIAEGFSYPKEKSAFQTEFSLERLRKRFAFEDTFYAYCHMPRHTEVLFYQYRFLKDIFDDSGKVIFLSGRYVEEEHQFGTMDVDKVFEEADPGTSVPAENDTDAPESAKHFSDAQVIACLASDYEDIAAVDLKTNTVRSCRASAKVCACIEGWREMKDFSKRRTLFAQEVVSRQEREEFLRALDPENIHKKLQTRSAFYFDFRMQQGRENQEYRLKVSVMDPSHEHVLIAIRNNQEEKDKLLSREQELAQTISERTAGLMAKIQELNRINEEIVEGVGDIVEARDSESGEHIKRVKGFTRILAEQVRLDCPQYHLTTDDINLITVTSVLHDVGKIMVPDAVLLKPGRLTKEEFAVMKTHTTKGCEVLERTHFGWSGNYLKTAMQIARSHHEKYDGRGYPDGLKGDEIPISAQIVSIADCFDALTTKRVYKDAYSPDKAYDMITHGECGMFSDHLLACFNKCKDQFFAFVTNPDKKDQADEDQEQENETISLDGQRILVVEDNDMNCEITKDLLEEEGAIVDTAENGLVAFNLFRERNGEFDAVLMDLIMPVMNGIDATKAIRALNIPSASTVPIIALTASLSSGDLQSCMDVGMNGHLTKPITLESLKKNLLQCLNNTAKK